MRENYKIVIVFMVIVFLISFFLIDINGENVVENTFYYNNLNKDEQKLYEKIDKTIISRGNEVSLYYLKFTEEEVKRILTFYFFENPEHFDLSKVYTIEENKKGKVKKIYLNYHLTHEEKEVMQKEIDEVVKEIKDNTKNMTNKEKSFYVYRVLVENNDYYRKGPFFNTIYGSMVLGKSNCEGMSSAYMYIMNELGIPTTQALGSIEKDGERENHSWNISLIDGELVYTDLTFAIGKNYNEDDFYKYLNMTKEESLKERNISIQMSVFGIY